MPGVGAYDPDFEAVSASAPAFTLKGSRSGPVSQNWQTPGPGTYEVAVRESGPKISLSSRWNRDLQELGADSAGPGAYDPDFARIRPRAPAFSLRGRNAQKDTETCAPGPGEYAPDWRPTCASAPAFSLASRHRQKEIGSDAPGAGTYYPEDVTGKTSPRAPAFTIGGRFRVKHPQEDTPGAGTYETPEFGRGPKFSFGIKHPDLASAGCAPGAGAYSPDWAKTRVSAPAFTIGARRRSRSAGEGTPGVGTYNLPAAGRGPAFSLSSRYKDVGEAQNVPGPGAYSEDVQKVSKRAPAFTIRPRWHERAPGEETPASNYYDAHWETTARSAPAYSLASRHRDLSKTGETPGPAAYGDADFQVLRRSAPKFTISGRFQDWQPESGKFTPGPGAYECPRGDPGPAFSLASRHAAQRSGSDAPGPGAYSADGLKTRPRAPAFTIRPRWARSHAGDAFPGPGAYDVRRCKSAGQTIGIRWREKLPGEATPGPGAYEPRFTSFEHRAPAFSMKSRHGGKNKVNVPGPGAYDVYRGGRLVSRSAPAHSIGVKF